MQRVLGVLDEAMTVHGALSGKVRLRAASGEELQLVASRGLSEDFQRRFARIRADEPAPSAIAWRTGRRVHVADAANDMRAALYREASMREGFVSMHSIPIVAPEGPALGALSTHFRQAPFWSGADRIVLEHCAAKLARLLKELFPKLA